MGTDKKGFIFNTKWALSSGAVFAITLFFLSSIGFTPEAPQTQASMDEPDVISAPAYVIADKEPNRVIIDAIGVDAAVLNPESRDIEVLDAALLQGVARYPGSADLAGVGNMFLFGHSSGLPVIYNQNFKVFNNLGKLVAGDLIRVRSDSTENVYRVASVRFAPESEITVPLAGSEKRLIITTCDFSVGDKSDRIIVEADFVGSFPLNAIPTVLREQ